MKICPKKQDASWKTLEGEILAMIVKRKGHKEYFEEKKAYASIYAACISASYSEINCEKIAEEITKKIKRKLVDRDMINSEEIRKIVMNELKPIDSELAFYYDQHLPNLKKL